MNRELFNLNLPLEMRGVNRRAVDLELIFAISPHYDGAPEKLTSWLAARMNESFWPDVDFSELYWKSSFGQVDHEDCIILHVKNPGTNDIYLFDQVEMMQHIDSAGYGLCRTMRVLKSPLLDAAELHVERQQ